VLKSKCAWYKNCDSPQLIAPRKASITRAADELLMALWNEGEMERNEVNEH